MDKYFVYRPLLDLIGYTEGTDERRGYNETLAYGALTGGDVNLVNMTLAEVEALQTKMLQHPKNKWKSSALGRYQIIRTTLRTIIKTLKLSKSLKFDKDMQDRMACYLLGVRGIDKYLAGRLSESTLINNLSKEWASLPTTDDKGAYAGQHARVTAARVRATLAEVRKRHASQQPKQAFLPTIVDKEVKKKFSLVGWVSGLFSGGGLGVAALAGFGWRELITLAGIVVCVGVAGLLLRSWIIRAIKEIRTELED